MTTVLCDTVKEALEGFGGCETTSAGARILTHCLYPSFDPVPVFIVKFGEGFIVHDGGEARTAAWLHGRDDKLITRCLNEQAIRFGLVLESHQLSVKVASADWLAAAIMSVANAASLGATDAVSRAAKSASDRLKERVFEILIRQFTLQRVNPHVQRRGESGKSYEFDFSVTDGTRSAVIDIVTPFPASIAHKYTAFSDARVREFGGAFAVHDSPLEPGDEALLSQVADVVPFASLNAGIERTLYVN